MKKIYFLLFCLTSYVSFGQTVINETFGTPTANTLITVYTGWTAGLPAGSYTGTGDVRTSTASTGYTGASASGNVFLTSTAGRNLIISNINTSAYLTADLKLSFGYLTSVAATQVVVEKSTDGVNWTAITFTPNANTSWNLVNVSAGQIPSTTTLSLRFTQPAAAQIRIDDVKIINSSSTCALNLGAPTTACSAVTSGIDTYSVTIPFTGGGTATYVLTANVGTVGGDNPSMMPSGNIVVSGINEGVNLASFTATGGTCNLSTTANAPECKPVNTLPFSEPFNYTVGASLNSTQQWSILNTGDDILVATGNLNYTGITPTGNSATFVGAGAESRTLFTNTTSGAVYASLLVSGSDLANVTTDLANTYFMFFGDAVAATTSARLWIRKNGTQYQYGLGEATAPTTWSPNLYNAGTTQYLVFGYDFATNRLSLYENGTIGGSASSTISVVLTTPLTGVGSLIFRQDGATTTPALIVDELKITTTPPFTLGAASFSQIEGLSMYPNPVKGGNLFIETALDGKVNVSLTNVLGQEVLNANTTNNMVNVSGLTKGIYVVKITEEGKVATKKLIIE